MNISFVFGFLTGCFVTIIGRYYLQKFTEQPSSGQIKKFDLDILFKDYPDFMNAIKDDLTAPNSKNIKEFFVVDKDAILNSSIPRLRYELSAEILPALNRLEALGYIEKLKNNCLHYKIKEDFIMQLKSIQFIDPNLSFSINKQAP